METKNQDEALLGALLVTLARRGDLAIRRAGAEFVGVAPATLRTFVKMRGEHSNGRTREKVRRAAEGESHG